MENKDYHKTITRRIFPILLISAVLISQTSFVLAAAGNCQEYCADQSLGEPEGVTCICSPTEYGTIESLIESVTNWVFYFGVIIFPLMIAVATFVLITSVGQPGKIKTARNILFWSVVGLIIILFSKGLISFIKNVLGA